MTAELVNQDVASEEKQFRSKVPIYMYLSLVDSPAISICRPSPSSYPPQPFMKRPAPYPSI